MATRIAHWSWLSSNWRNKTLLWQQSGDSTSTQPSTTWSNKTCVSRSSLHQGKTRGQNNSDSICEDRRPTSRYLDKGSVKQDIPQFTWQVGSWWYLLTNLRGSVNKSFWAYKSFWASIWQLSYLIYSPACVSSCPYFFITSAWLQCYPC